MALWSETDFINTVDSCFAQATANTEAFQKTLVSQFNAVVIKGTINNLRPTMYDIVLHEAIEYYKFPIKRDYSSVNRKINDFNALANIEDFAKAKLNDSGDKDYANIAQTVSATYAISSKQ
jgi:hypothetical protein